LDWEGFIGFHGFGEMVAEVYALLFV